MIERLAARRRARAFQHALERYERLVEQGADPAAAAGELALELGPDARAFMLATSLTEVAAPVPDPEFTDAFAALLRGMRWASPSPGARVGTLRPRVPFAAGTGPLAVAACTILFAALLIPSLNALPGDRLYGLKGATEDVRVFLASGPAEADIRVSLANERFVEVERLVERARARRLVSAFSSTDHSLVLAGPGTDEIDDPDLARLIEAALADAGRQLEKAAEILTTSEVPAEDLDELVVASQRGQQLATKVADDLPHPISPPFVRTAVKLAKIEAEAKAAQMKVESVQPSVPVCATPKPSVTPTPLPQPSADPQPTAAAAPQSSATPTPEASPSPSPEPTPCTTPEPSPSPTPSPTPATPAPAAGAEPTPAPQSHEGTQSENPGEGGENTEVLGPDEPTSEA